MNSNQLDEEPTHIYDWLEEKPEIDTVMYKVWEYLDYRTKSASYQAKHPNEMKGMYVFCEYKGIVYKITGASRLGDVWLNTNFQAEHGYTLRVCIDDCTNFTYEDNRMNSKNSIMLAGMMAMASSASIRHHDIIAPRIQKHKSFSKPVQSEEAKQTALDKAQAKRDRKALIKTKLKQ